MATGDTLAQLHPCSVVGSAEAGGVAQAGGSAVDGSLATKAFPAHAPGYAAWQGIMPLSYAGGGLRIRGVLRATNGTVGAARLEGAYRRLHAADVLPSAHTFAWLSVSVSAPATRGLPVYWELPFTQAQADGVLGGEEFLFLLRRATADPADTLAGHALLSTVTLLQG